MPDPTERELLLVATELNEAARDITFALLQPAKGVESRNLRVGQAREAIRKALSRLDGEEKTDAQR